MGIVGGNQRQPHLVCQIHGQIQALFLNLKSRVLDFHVEAVAEDFGVPLDQLPGFVVLFGQQHLRQF